jgi:hypothetical protein
MKFDEEGRVVWTPRELFALAVKNPRRLIDGFLMAGYTPAAFPSQESYCAFLEEISGRIGVHPRSLYLRGNCQIGFSIAPRVDKVWAAPHDRSDLDLVIIDADYFRRIEEEIDRWERRNHGPTLPESHAEAFTRRKEDRLYNCCWDRVFPPPVGAHHRDVMRIVADMRHCGMRRPLSAFLYPDWLSARRRYDRDVRLLVEGVRDGNLEEPDVAPIVSRTRRSVAGPAMDTAPGRPPQSPGEDFAAGIFGD